MAARASPRRCTKLSDPGGRRGSCADEGGSGAAKQLHSLHSFDDPVGQVSKVGSLNDSCPPKRDGTGAEVLEQADALPGAIWSWISSKSPSLKHCCAIDAAATATCLFPAAALA